MAIEVVNRQRLVRVDRKALAALAGATLEAIGRADASLTVAFVRDRTIRDLNRAYKGKDRATDVLSFPADDERVDSAGGKSRYADADTMNYIGDIIIATDTALRQAEEAGHSFEREASELIIHGALHLCRYDHETDHGEMNRLELKLRRKLLKQGLDDERAAMNAQRGKRKGASE